MHLLIQWWKFQSLIIGLSHSTSCYILVMPSAWPGGGKYQCLTHWFDRTGFLTDLWKQVCLLFVFVLHPSNI